MRTSRVDFHLCFHRFLELLCPSRCVRCRAPLDRPVFQPEFCVECRERLFRCTGEQYCRRCGGRRPSDSENTRNNDAGNNDAGENEARKDDSRFSCDRCRDDFFFFHRAVVLGDYEDALRSLVLRMKTERRGLSMLAVAGLLWERREHPIREANADRIVPVPMHFARRFWRGVNSPDILAGELGRRLGIPVLDRLVRRVKPTRPQFSLAPEERFENLQGAFSLSQHRRRTGRAGVNEDISNKRILLVDDILTTGNTCNTVSRLLLDAGAASVTVVAVAKAEGNKGGNKVGKAAGKTGSMRTAVKDSEDESGFQR